MTVREQGQMTPTFSGPAILPRPSLDFFYPTDDPRDAWQCPGCFARLIVGFLLAYSPN